MTTVVTTPFTGSDNAAWPAPWTQNGGTSRIASNRGEQTPSTSPWTSAENLANVVLADGRVDTTLRFPALTNRSQRINVRWNPATGNGYRLIIPGDYNGFQLLRVDGYTETPLQEEFASIWAANTDYRVAIEFIGTTIRAKRWAVGQSEPDTWGLTATDSNYASGDVALVTVVGGDGGTVTGLWDDVSVVNSGVVRSSSRVGFHNDAFLAPFDDYGTFTTFTDNDVATTRAYLESQVSLGVPMVGESAATNGSHSMFPSAGTELAKFRWSGINPSYHPDVLASWSSAEKLEVARRLGYRLRLISASLPITAKSGGSIPVKFVLINDGYAATYRARPMQVVLVNGGAIVTRTLAFDIRTVGPGQTVTVEEQITAPGLGTWIMYLRFPDPTVALAARPEYAIQLANTGMWDSVTGRNALGVSLVSS